jgi:hypothetical protein
VLPLNPLYMRDGYASNYPSESFLTTRTDFLLNVHLLIFLTIQYGFSCDTVPG